MKYQNFAVIFVIIILPISIVFSFYVQNQTDTLNLLTQYKSKLTDSTYDAVTAYQMNSLNTQKVTGESVKSYVLASVNTFFTSLASNMGMSSAAKSKLQAYIPAILFTTYDGYYIYTPMRMKNIAENPEDGTAIRDNRRDIFFIDKDADTDYERTDLRNEAREPRNNPNLTQNESDAKNESKYMLKPFIYYSAQYKINDNNDFVASYTLDNYVTLYGTKSSNRDDSGIHGYTNEFSKSGYLIDPSKIKIDGNLLVKAVTRDPSNNNKSEVELGIENTNKTDYIATYNANMNEDANSYNNVRFIPLSTIVDDGQLSNDSVDIYNYINYFYYEGEQERAQEDYGGETYFPTEHDDTTSGNIIRFQTGDEIIEATLDIEDLIKNGNFGTSDFEDISKNLLTREIDSTHSNEIIQVEYNGIPIRDREAKEYYIKAYFFSLWVDRNLDDVEAQNIVQTDAERNSLQYTNFSNDSSRIFNIFDPSNENNPESEKSSFVQHKKAVIKNSIQSNLNSAIATYNRNFLSDVEYFLPIMNENDWDSILNNVCMATFMEGIPCGTETFNNYCVVKSNNNNTSVSIDNLYFTNQIGRNARADNYHKYDCPEMGKNNAGESINDYNLEQPNCYEADLSAEFKYDAKKINVKIYNSNQIVCAYDSASNKYYHVERIDNSRGWTDINNIKVIYNDEINNITDYTNTDPRLGPQISTGIDLTSLVNGSDSIYLYDHQNLECYRCLTAGNYTPAVKFIDGELYRTYSTEDYGLLLQQEPGGPLIHEDGRSLTTEESEDIGVPNENDFQITVAEFNKRKQSIYTAIAKYRNSIYKTNDYVNR